MPKIKPALLAGIALAATFTLSCSDDAAPSGSEGKKNDISEYKTIPIADSIRWMAENLNYAVEGSKCYDNLNSNCLKYGRLYNWATAMALDTSCNAKSCVDSIQSPHQGICPDGWHIPSDADWNALVDYAGGDSAGIRLRARSGWDSHNGIGGNGTDDFGFSALPGGYGHEAGNFENAGYVGRWWSTKDNGSNFAYTRTIHFNLEKIISQGYGETLLFSVRCVQD